ncbi:unnamed protein product [Protopolystoma xenopodis]|uniref:Uncharacterized protein n=1 Tax=Protopolystoma xenopodis TaxID=117903 RepID=A0A448X3T1_9PLAT|nr:unnamed protein product [Protopolystoma xenopodis]
MAYGLDDDSDSDVEAPRNRSVSSSQAPKESVDPAEECQKRRSCRNTGGQKKYIIDTDLGLSEDNSDEQIGDESLMETTDMLDEGEVKVVQKILGRRMLKRIVKRKKSSLSSLGDKKTDSETFKLSLDFCQDDDHNSSHQDGGKTGASTGIPHLTPTLGSDKLHEAKGTDDLATEVGEKSADHEEIEEEIEEFYLKYKG